MQRAKQYEDGQPPQVATIGDVARHAGVSTATVSRVLNGTGAVRATLVDRVHVACAALHYRPNVTARILAGGRSRSLGLWAPDIRNRFFLEIVDGVLQTAQELGYLVTLATYPGHLPSRRHVHYAELLTSAALDGAIVVGSYDREVALRLFRQRRIPVVTIDHQAVDETSDLVNIDNVQAAHDVVSYLAAQGYRRIGIIAGPQDTMTGRDRLTGYRLGLQAAGLAHDPLLEFARQYDEESGYQGTLRLLDVPEPMDALFTTSNGLTVGALHALHDRGKRLPEDLAMVAFDAMPWKLPGAPALTCVLQPTVALGSTATRLLVQRLQHPEGHVRQQVILQHQLEIGDTTPPARNRTPA